MRTLLEDLAFVDGHDDDRERAFARLQAQGLWGAFGTSGVLASTFPEDADTTYRLASIFARVAAELGYFTPARRLTDAEWDDARAAAAWATARPRLADDVERRFGAPSYRSKGQWPRVFAYAGAMDDAWLYFDFSANIDRPTLEVVRSPTSDFVEGVVDLRPPRDGEGPEHAYRRFLIATLSGKEAELRALSLPHEDVAELATGAYPDDVAQALASVWQEMDVVRVPPPDDVVYLVSDGWPLPTAVVRHGDEWRVDADELVRAQRSRRAAAGAR